ncbi:MAG: serine/threonine-protein kinase [Sediminibacterium sp.]|nr:serine/threonine-protein kinase [Sediminibacterium sp.]
MAEWIINRIIDQGGFGKVFEVQSDNGQKAALKELLSSSHTPNLQRFKTEINILKNYNHKHIIKILDSNIKGNPPNYGPWYVMEFMSGGSLKSKNTEMFRNEKLWSQKWTLKNVIFPVLDAIEYAHNHYIFPSFHRDLKPANLLFTDQNLIKVADWGIGKDINKQSIALTVGGMGTPGYCSPEQWLWFPGSNITVDGRTDIYALGIIFYEMMTGKIPQIFNGNTGQSFATPAPPSNYHPSISKDLNIVILKMMTYNLNDRYQNVQQVKNALQPILNSL